MTLYPWARSERYENSSLDDRLSAELRDFVRFISPAYAEFDVRRVFVDRIAETVHRVWPHARMQVYGSLASGLYLPQSDIDLVIFGVGAHGPKPLLQRLSRELLKRGVACQARVLSSAKVPIVKIVDAATLLNADICFNIASGPQTTAALQDLLDQYPMARPLILFLKALLVKRGLHEPFRGGLGSYPLALLVVSHIQHHERNYGVAAAKVSLGRLLRNFFHLYGSQFDFERHGVSVRGEGAYFSKAERQWFDPRWPMHMAIEDPNQHNNDVGRSCRHASIIRHLFERAYTLLSTTTIAPPPPRPLGCPLLLEEGTDAPTLLGRVFSLHPAFSAWRAHLCYIAAPDIAPLPPGLDGDTVDAMVVEGDDASDTSLSTVTTRSSNDADLAEFPPLPRSRASSFS